MTQKQNTSRRSFIKTASAAGAGLFLPYHFSAAPSLAFDTGSANDKVDIALIGAGGMGGGNINAAKKWLNLVAIADVDSGRAESMKAGLGQGKADVYSDYRKILERDDIKVVHIATPDHWHTKPLIEAMYAGKDVYCEKPLTLTIDEGKLIRKVQKETGRIVQVGTQQRSTFNLFTKAMALVKDGRLGKIKKIQVAIGGAPSSPALPVADVPTNLDWDRWLGPAPKADYRMLKPEKGRPQTNGHYEFRWWYEYSGGKLTDWGAHHVDIGVWALELNGQNSQPLSIEGTAEHPVEFKDGKPVQTDRYNTATKFSFTVKFPEGAEMVIRHDTSNGVLIEGDKGRIFVSRGSLKGKPVEDLESKPLPEGIIKEVYKGYDPVENERRAHWANFLHCVDQQVEPISDVHSHMRMLNICHLAGICARVGRKLDWDAASESIKGDDLANSMLSRPYREGYEIEMGVPAGASS
ncbi:Gfo/Idh/MocA family protein [Mariniblastus fucicola]|uniref:Inositol 2-dehydrogenase n=1 Tax=Mariniblastus fucicola TaxID=980251 RepID=A0A5B9PH92_9BACT|nr:Gfo/Idh/MocA family oxidoreductase [Mariniblastus fucicola]QEG23986.1 Inositol 2-dehydrogenase [Mariniblastus fucicola]